MAVNIFPILGNLFRGCPYMTSCWRGEGGRVCMTNNVEGFIKKHDGGGGWGGV